MNYNEATELINSINKLTDKIKELLENKIQTNAQIEALKIDLSEHINETLNYLQRLLPKEFIADLIDMKDTFKAEFQELRDEINLKHQEYNIENLYSHLNEALKFYNKLKINSENKNEDANDSISVPCLDLLIKVNSSLGKDFKMFVPSIATNKLKEKTASNIKIPANQVNFAASKKSLDEFSEAFNSFAYHAQEITKINDYLTTITFNNKTYYRTSVAEENEIQTYYPNYFAPKQTAAKEDKPDTNLSIKKGKKN